MTRFRNLSQRFFAQSNRLQLGLSVTVLCLAATYVWVLRTGTVSASQRRLASADGVWQPLAQESRAGKLATSLPAQGARLQLNAQALTRRLSTAMRETGNSLAESRTFIELPLPDGDYATFRIEESPVLDDGLSARFPEIKSYRGVAVNDARITMRTDWTPQGLHAVIMTPQNTFTIHPVDQNTTTEYVAYDAGVQQAATEKDFECLVNENFVVTEGLSKTVAPLLSVGPSRRNYRMAFAATWEYCETYGAGTVAGTVSSLNTWLTGINAIYERELNIRLTMVNDTDALFCTESGFNAGSDPFANGSPSAMLPQGRPQLRDLVGAANYDIGHTMGTGGGGVAWLGVVCNDGNINGDSLGPAKGGGISCVGGPLGNSGFLNVIVHEIGHQFGAAHSFNGTTGNCGGGNRSSGSAVEPGSGSTIMSYAGLCGTDNIVGGSDMRFHAWSYAQIINFANTKTCHSTTNTGNTAPTINGGSDYTIPRQTPFQLTAVGNDADAGDIASLTYAWEQIDVGGTSFGNPPYTDAADAANSTRPLFRSYGPVSSASRTFPALTYILNNANTAPATVGNYQTADSLSNINRTLRFRAVIRDQRGGVTDDEVLLTVNASAGPFLVTAPNAATTWTGGTSQTVTWSVNNTTAAPISCANVSILLSTDGGQTFPHTLAASTPNDGSASVTVPNGISNSTTRIRVQAVGNIFFDISDVNITLTPGSTCPSVNNINPSSGNIGTSVVITGTQFTGVTAVKFNNNIAATFTVNSDSQITATVPAGATTGSISISKASCGDVQTSTYTVTPCSYSVSPNPANFNSTAGVGNITVTASSTPCAWSASNTSASWITNISPTSSNGTGVVTFNVAANTGAARVATLAIAGQSVTVAQLSSNPNADTDNDGIPDTVEITEGTNLVVKDNDIFANTALGRRLFIMQQYRDFLGREGDANGINNWVNALNTNGLTRTQVIESFFNSTEFTNTVAPVTRLYFAAFLRIPDYVGLVNWVNAYRTGTTLPTIAQAFVTSPEFLQTYGNLDNAQYVTLLYLNVLGRSPDSVGLNSWVGLLNSGTSRGQVLLGFSESAEYVASSGNNVFVTMIYVGMLRRSPDTNGFNNWVSALNGGGNRLSLIQGFLDSLEYRSRFLPN